MPGYAMLVFQLQMGLCKDIAICVFKFWWSNKECKKEIAWVRKDILNQSKKKED